MKLSMADGHTEKAVHATVDSAHDDTCGIDPSDALQSDLVAWTQAMVGSVEER